MPGHSATSLVCGQSDAKQAVWLRSASDDESVADAQRSALCRQCGGFTSTRCPDATRRSCVSRFLLLPPCFLRAGIKFRGTQRVSSTAQQQPSQQDDSWTVHVNIEHVDMCRGTLSGTMEAINVPSARSRVVTSWEGEIIDHISDRADWNDAVSHSFFTRKWGASQKTDLEHWTLFSSFNEKTIELLKRKRCGNVDGGTISKIYREKEQALAERLSQEKCIFMRWKEKRFVNVDADCGLTIAGFYYVCFDQATGGISGYYADPNSSPFQHLSLSPVPSSRGGYAFPVYSLR